MVESNTKYDCKNPFGAIPGTPPDPIFAMKSKYVNDTHPKKVALIIGAYRDMNGDPWILPSVQ